MGSYPHIHRLVHPLPGTPSPFYRRLISTRKGGLTTNGIHLLIPASLSNRSGPPQSSGRIPWPSSSAAIRAGLAGMATPGRTSALSGRPTCWSFVGAALAGSASTASAAAAPVPERAVPAASVVLAHDWARVPLQWSSRGVRRVCDAALRGHARLLGVSVSRGRSSRSYQGEPVRLPPRRYGRIPRCEARQVVGILDLDHRRSVGTR